MQAIRPSPTSGPCCTMLPPCVCSSIEDNPKMAELIRRVLTAERISVDVVADGTAGVGAGRRHRPST